MSGKSFGELTRTPGLKLGTYIGEFAGPAIARIVQSAGCDFAMVDMEHSGFTFETAKSQLRHLHDAGVASTLRPPSKATHHIARACDVGAQGVMPAMLGSTEEARRILEVMKYVPDGRRGVALGIAHDDYAPGPVADKFAAANRKTSLVALIETAEGVQNVEAIAAVDGVDCLWIGHFDLSCALGIPGRFDHPDFAAAVTRVVAAGKAAGKALGRLVPTVEEGAARYAEGFDMIIYSGDVWLLQAALASGVSELRAKCGA
jgi:2-keto-3-deoxy-L-rhamnonate aldolase RhmA